MSTRINTNVTALEAAQNLNANSNNLSTNIERLSSGLRINSAADDPAGLAISNNFKAQISGLTQATSNSNDAINEVKTAEGALTQVQNLLTSLRQLAVQASNVGTNSSVDLQADQTQINSAISSINEIAATTQFGNKFLLNGSATSASTTTAGTAIATGNISLAANGSYTAATAGTYSVSVTAATAATDAFNFTNGTSTALASSATGVYSGSIIINGTQYQLSTAAPNTLSSLNAAIASSGYQASVGSNGQLTFTNQTTGALATSQSFNTTNLTVGTNSLIGTTTGTQAFTAGTAVKDGGTATGNLGAASTFSGVGSITIGYSNSSTGYSLTSVTIAITAGESLSAVEASVSTATAGAVTLGLDSTGTTLSANAVGGTSVTYSDSANSLVGGGFTATVGVAATSTHTTLAQETVASSAGVGSSTLTSSSLFSGVITVAGAATATLTIAPNTNLAGLNAALSAASVGVAAEVNSSGALIFTNTASSSSAPTVNLGSSFSAYNALTSANGVTGASTPGADASLTLYNGSQTLTSQSTQTINGTNFFNFSNGAVIATTVTSGSVVGSLTTTAGTSTIGQSLEFQTGANGGQTNSLDIQSVAANLLGNGTGSYVDANGTTQTVQTDSIADINVLTFKGSQDAIAVIDNAINQISTLSANLGAFQTNVLQSNVTSLGVAQTNLSSSLSTVEDTDLSTEIVDYTKNQILVQAATSALGQANQAPQAILKLLQ